MFQNVCIWNQIEFLNICRWNRIIKSTIPRAKRIRTKKYFNLPRLQKEVRLHAQRVYSTYWYIIYRLTNISSNIHCIEQGLLDAPLIAVTGSEQLPDKTTALLLDCCDTSTTRVYLLEYACEPQEKTDDVGAAQLTQ